MNIDFNKIAKNAKRMAGDVAKHLSKNKHLYIEGGLGGLAAYLGIDSLIKDNKHKEKERLYQETIKKQNAEIQVAKEAVEEAAELKKVNTVLVDVIEDMKKESSDNE